MKEKSYIYSETPSPSLIKKILFDYEVVNLNEDDLADAELKNKNILFIFKNEIKKNLSESFIINNNIVFFSQKKLKSQENQKFSQAKFIHGPLHIKKFVNILRGHFNSNQLFFSDIRILDEKIINNETGLSCSLTILEKKILIEFIDKKSIERGFFLEKILKIKKDIETKTIESHLTRIRKKLFKIKSKIRITSKGDIFYLED